jgi:hypothetical protein
LDEVQKFGACHREPPAGIPPRGRFDLKDPSSPRRPRAGMRVAPSPDGTFQQPVGTDLMFAFYSNQLGCLGSIVLSLIGTVILFLVIQSCQGP